MINFSKKNLPVVFLITGVLMAGCTVKKNTSDSSNINSSDPAFADKTLNLALAQFDLLTQEALKANRIPRTITEKGHYQWTHESFDWTEGFFPGTSWYFYELTKDEKWKNIAQKFQAQFESDKFLTTNHDLGFVFNCSYGNGFRLTKKETFKQVMITAGNALITRFNPTIGCIKSWDVTGGWQAERGWQFPVIIDNMMNLELLFELTKLTGDPKYREVAIHHANTTIKNHFRLDNSSWHVVDYDPITGRIRGKHTAQGAANESPWARGQAWGLYGFVICYRYTKNPVYLKQAEKIADFIIENERIPADKIPYWDYDAPKIPNEPRDASAAAITASALIELSDYTDKKYLNYATDILKSLSSDAYFAKKGTNHNFILKHSVGSMPHGNEIDVPLNYADYYFIEALLRFKNKETNSKHAAVINGDAFLQTLHQNHLKNQTANISTYWINYLESRKEGTDLYNPNSFIDSRFVPNNFSYAGYHHSNKSLPTEKELSDYRLFNVSEFGAIPNDGKSDKAAIKKAMTAILAYQKNSANGAILYFPEGRFIINDEQDMSDIDPNKESDILNRQVIALHASNFVLRGAGADKTTLWMKTHLLPLHPNKKWTTPYILQLGASETLATLATKIISSNAPNSTKSVQVAEINLFKIGDYVELKGVITDLKKIKATVSPYELELNAITKEYVWKNMTDGLDKKEKHQIVKIEGNRLTFAAPIAHEIDATDNWEIRPILPAVEIGVENITFAGNWHEKFVHHKDARGDSGFSLFEITNAANSWMRNVTFSDFIQAASFRNTFNTTSENITLTGIQGHSAFSISYGNNNLTKNVKDLANTWHAPGFSKYSISNVHLRMSYDPTSTSDLHGEQSLNNLFDNTDGGWVRHRWGAADFNQPNHLKGLIYWNHNNTGKAVDNFEFMDSKSIYGRLIMPHLIGLHGHPISFQHQKYFSEIIKSADGAGYKELLPDEPQAFLEFYGQKVLPVSLYEAQLEYRRSLLQ